jgi:hypothetical protein
MYFFACSPGLGEDVMDFFACLPGLGEASEKSRQ